MNRIAPEFEIFPGDWPRFHCSWHYADQTGIYYLFSTDTIHAAADPKGRLERINSFAYGRWKEWAVDPAAALIAAIGSDALQVFTPDASDRWIPLDSGWLPEDQRGLPEQLHFDWSGKLLWLFFRRPGEINFSSIQVRQAGSWELLEEQPFPAESAFTIVRPDGPSGHPFLTQRPDINDGTIVLLHFREGRMETELVRLEPHDWLTIAPNRTELLLSLNSGTKLARLAYPGLEIVGEVPLDEFRCEGQLVFLNDVWALFRAGEAFVPLHTRSMRIGEAMEFARPSLTPGTLEIQQVVGD